MTSVRGPARPSNPLLAYSSWVAVCLIWGTTYLAIRIALETLPPGLMAGLRWMAAGVALAAVQVARGRTLPGPKAWPLLALIGLLFVVGGNGLVVWAEQWVPSGLTAVLLATSPFWTVGVEAIWPNGERPCGRTWVGLAIGFAGMVVLVWSDLAAGGAAGAAFLLGVAGVQAACVTWSVGVAVERRRDTRQHALGGAALQMIFGGLVLVAAGSAAGEWPRLAFSARSAAAFGYLVVAGSMVAYSAYIYTLEHLPVSTVSLSAYINPIIAVVLGTVVAGEPFGARTVAASVVVLAGVAVVRSAAPGEVAQAGAAPEPGAAAAKCGADAAPHAVS